MQRTDTYYMFFWSTTFIVPSFIVPSFSHTFLSHIFLSPPPPSLSQRSLYAQLVYPFLSCPIGDLAVFLLLRIITSRALFSFFPLI
ncbi:hypothetical protein BC939DRAFT_441391 [Gamsiella multidivaricata]|uniref:uncharacterized protein n=1 Tax=Gamsiella multidivaricata TaxID=101098 RepID=UPI00221EC725|nr:uncharacterized protein BC939DRAFT_441391 [Gamsiella multidivaricata]KAI7829653.1 hypothetical protein BC939DRAFT_441391 [Gamsiella multidivaricata]